MWCMGALCQIMGCHSLLSLSHCYACPISCASPSRAVVPSWNIHLFLCGVLHGPSVDTCSGLVFTTGFREVLALACGASLHPPSLALVFAHLFLSHFLTLIAAAHFLTYVFPKMPPSWLKGSAVSCGVSYGAGWNWLRLTRGSPWSPHRGLPCRPQADKILSQTSNIDAMTVVSAT